jgi:hypothetical protein
MANKKQDTTEKPKATNIIKAKVRIRGLRPLLQHRFTEAALPLEKQERTGVAGNDPEEWRKTCMVNKDGQLFIESTYVFSALRNGAKFTKKGKGSIQFDVAATLQIVDDEVLLDRFYPGFPNGHDFNIKTVEAPPREKSEPVYLDIAGVRNPSSKARNVRYRLATAKGWQTEFILLWDKTIVSTPQMQAVCIDTGVLVGLADGRSVGYGRFEVENFEVLDS